MDSVVSWWLVEGLLHFLWQGLVIGLVLAFALRHLRRSTSEQRYVAGSIALLAMAVCLPVTLATLAAHGRLDTARQSRTATDLDRAEEVVSQRQNRLASQGFTPSPTDRAESEARERTSDTINRSTGAPSDVVPVSPLTDANAEAETASSLWVNALALAYFGGVVLMLSRVVFMVSGSHRLRRSAKAIDDPRVVELVGQLAIRLKLRVTPKVACCRQVVAPAVVGVLRPMILFPPAMLSGLSPTQIETILLHELAHIRRHDVLLLSLQRVVESILFFHPVVWYASRVMSVEREHCCDDCVVRSGIGRTVYADALVRAAELSLDRSAPASSAVIACAIDRQSELNQRILRLVSPSNARATDLYHSRATVAGVSFLMLAVICSVLAIPKWTVGQDGNRSVKGNDPPTDRHSLLEIYRSSQFRVGSRETLDPIDGRVYGRDGRPVANASVYLREHTWQTDSWGRLVPAASRGLAVTQTDAQGRYSFQDIVSQPLGLLRQKVMPVDVIVVADDYAVSWRRMERAARADFQLQPPGQVTGRVVDEQGKPLAGMQVRVLRFLPLTEVANMDLASRVYPRFVGNCLDLASAEFDIAARVDDQGEFVLSNLPRNSGVVLQISSPRFYNEVVYTTANPGHPVWQGQANLAPPMQTTYVVPSPMARAKAADRGSDRPAKARFGLRESVQESPIKVEMQAGVRVRVRIVEDETGNPVSGAALPQAPVFEFPPRGRADEAGVYEYTQLTPGEFTLYVEPPEGARRLGQRTSIRIDSNAKEVETEVRLPRGAVISGRVVDRETTRGVEGVHVNQATTDAQGRFELVTAPGAVTLSLYGRVDGYRIASRPSDARGPHTQTVEAVVENPVRGVEFLVDPDTLFFGRTLDPQGDPIGGVRITGQKNVRHVGGGVSYTSIDQASDGDGMYVLPGLFADDSRKRVADVPITFRDESRSLAVRVSFSKLAGDDKTVHRDIQLLPAGIVAGRVLHAETKQPLPGVRVAITSWNGTSGRFSGSAQTDAEGRFVYRCLVPDAEYSVGFSKEQYVPVGGHDGDSDHFRAQSGESFAVADFLMKPKPQEGSPPVVAKLEPPSVDGLEGKRALEKLLAQFEVDQADYRDRINATSDAREKREIVARREPSPVYATALMDLAERFPDSDIELQSLVWVCGARVVSGSDTKQYRQQKVTAAKRLLDKYIERQEIVECLDSLVYRSGTPHVTAKRLLNESPHRDVRGRACLLVAQTYERDLDSAHRWGRVPDESDRQSAIEYYQKVTDEYADLSDWRYDTIGKRAEQSLCELQFLWVGQPAPEIAGEDLQGDPLKLSDHRGKIVILAFTLQIDWWDLLARDIRAAGYESDKVVVLGVYSGDNRQTALAEAKENKIDWPIWFDGDEDRPDSITRQWNNTSWPNIYVIDQDGVIRRRNMDRNGIPGAIEELWR